MKHRHSYTKIPDRMSFFHNRLHKKYTSMQFFHQKDIWVLSHCGSSSPFFSPYYALKKRSKCIYHWNGFNMRIPKTSILSFYTPATAIPWRNDTSGRVVHKQPNVFRRTFATLCTATFIFCYFPPFNFQE